MTEKRNETQIWAEDVTWILDRNGAIDIERSGEFLGNIILTPDDVHKMHNEVQAHLFNKPREKPLTEKPEGLSEENIKHLEKRVREVAETQKTLPADPSLDQMLFDMFTSLQLTRLGLENAREELARMSVSLDSISFGQQTKASKQRPDPDSMLTEAHTRRLAELCREMNRLCLEFPVASRNKFRTAIQNVWVMRLEEDEPK